MKIKKKLKIEAIEPHNSFFEDLAESLEESDKETPVRRVSFDLNDALDSLDELQSKLDTLHQLLFGNVGKDPAIKDLGPSIQALATTTKSKATYLVCTLNRIMQKL
jgi:Zn-finger domain-containing protein